MKNTSISELGGIIKLRDLRNLQSLASAFNASLLSAIIGSDVAAFCIFAKKACINIPVSFLWDTSVWLRSNSYALVSSLALDALMFSCSMKPLRLLIAPGLSGLSSSDLSVEVRA